MSSFAKAFQAKLYKQIPLVEFMRLSVTEISDSQIIATAPIEPNINDKNTVFGGSSAALMTICGWSLIKSNLEHQQIDNDVVIHQAKTDWVKAQEDDLIIEANLDEAIIWRDIAYKLAANKGSLKVNVNCQVLNTNREVCTTMMARFVILRK